MPSLSTISFSAYKDLVDLSPPSSTRVDRPHALTESELCVAQVKILLYLWHEYGAREIPSQSVLEQWPATRRAGTIRALLTVRSSEYGLLPDDIQQSIDALLENNLLSVALTPVEAIKPISNLYTATQLPDVLDRIMFWRGDITRLASPNLAIANACNTALLGCFRPQHLCVDNVIHAAAGPRLRLDCATIMNAQGTSEPEGNAKITKAWQLPCAYVLHTVGPQVPRGSQPSEAQERALASCYESCLDLADEVKQIHHVAFPCISTGLFGFPGDRAAHVALKAVSDWLLAHPDSSISSVIFTLFLEADEHYYLDALSTIFETTMPTPSIGLPAVIPEIVREWVNDAEAILIHCGAGLSADAVNPDIGLGLDYTSRELFEKVYPGFVRDTEMEYLYQSIGYSFPDDQTKWAFYLRHINVVLNWGLTPVYSLLRQLVGLPSENDVDAQPTRPFFVMTSNVDNLFYQSGFSPQSVFTPQGSYNILQCLEPCSEDSFWPAQASIENALQFISRPDVSHLPEDRPDLIPTCPRCGGEAMLNVRGGPWFLETPFKEQRERYEEFVNSLVEEGKRVAIIELGSGFNTPSVVRFPGERLAGVGAGNIKLIRVNLKDPEVPTILSTDEKAIGLRMGAVRFLEALLG